MDALKREFRAYEDRVPTRIINELKGPQPPSLRRDLKAAETIEGDCREVEQDKVKLKCDVV